MERKTWPEQMIHLQSKHGNSCFLSALHHCSHPPLWLFWFLSRFRLLSFSTIKISSKWVNCRRGVGNKNKFFTIITGKNFIAIDITREKAWLGISLLTKFGTNQLFNHQVFIHFTKITLGKKTFKGIYIIAFRLTKTGNLNTSPPVYVKYVT